MNREQPSLEHRPVRSSVTGRSPLQRGSPPARIGEMDEHRRVSLSCMHPASERYVWASGVTQIARGRPWPRSRPVHPARALAASTRLALRDEEKARELWTPGLRPWLPYGRDDPEAVLLKVSIEEAEYWERGRGEVIPLISAAREPHSVRIKSARAPREGVPRESHQPTEKTRREHS